MYFFLGSDPKIYFGLIVLPFQFQTRKGKHGLARKHFKHILKTIYICIYKYPWSSFTIIAYDISCFNFTHSVHFWSKSQAFCHFPVLPSGWEEREFYLNNQLLFGWVLNFSKKNHSNVWLGASEIKFVCCTLTLSGFL